MLPLGLKESISKVRNTVAFSLAGEFRGQINLKIICNLMLQFSTSGIAHWDWPDAWPGLFDILMEAVRADHEFAVQGAVR